MENQHRKITGYRELDQREIDLMNEIKILALAMASLHLKVVAHVNEQVVCAAGGDATLAERIKQTEPGRWASIGRTHLQEGCMALVRAVAQPTSF